MFYINKKKLSPPPQLLPNPAPGDHHLNELESSQSSQEFQLSGQMVFEKWSFSQYILMLNSTPVGPNPILKDHVLNKLEYSLSKDALP